MPEMPVRIYFLYLKDSIAAVKKILLLFPFFLITVSSTLRAQNSDITFEQISLEQGLSQSIVECIVQDNQGFMWFATEDGLNKYDGYTFNVFLHNAADHGSLSSNDIKSLCVDVSGALWIGMFQGGLNRYDREQEKFAHWRYDPDDPGSLSNDIVRALWRLFIISTTRTILSA